jgi:hypothetical protein
MTILSDPPGAIVWVNGREVGATPVDVPSDMFIYYGDYDITLVMDGFEPLKVRQAVPSPWYEYFPIDFFSENVVPWHTKDHRVFTYQLAPARIVPREELLRNANLQRSRGQGIQGVPELPPGPPGDEPAMEPPARPTRLTNPFRKK